jgi:hypothetical protein
MLPLRKSLVVWVLLRQVAYHNHPVINFTASIGYENQPPPFGMRNSQLFAAEAFAQTQ